MTQNKMNIMKGICEQLGIFLNEEFCITGDINHYKITNEGFQCCEYRDGKKVTEWNPGRADVWNELLLGKKEIVKKQYNPQKGDKFFSYNDKWFIVQYLLDTDAMNINMLCRKQCNIIFRSHQEAMNARPEAYFNLTGKIWDDYLKEHPEFKQSLEKNSNPQN